MLDLAIKHKVKLEKEMLEIMFKEQYKFYNPSSYYEEFKLDEKDIGWHSMQFVSYDKLRENIVGYMSATIDRDSEIVSGLSIVNFSGNRAIFGRDLREFLLRIAKRQDIRKICFSASMENPINKTYQKMIRKYNGRIVGTNLQHYKLFDGTYSDRVIYEINTEEIRKTLMNRGRIV